MQLVIGGAAGPLPTKVTQDHHINELSSSFVFKAEEDGRRAKKTCIALVVLACPAHSRCCLSNGLEFRADLPSGASQHRLPTARHDVVWFGRVPIDGTPISQFKASATSISDGSMQCMGHHPNVSRPSASICAVEPGENDNVRATL